MTKIALYMRISVDEYGRDESNSITNQRSILNFFLDQSPEFQNFQRVEFVDDGYSGTSTNRPAFQRLISEVKSGKLQHIIVKDLSRFMRDYLDLGNFLENIFPFLGIRFVAINDKYDSKTSENNGLEIDVPFRNLLNDFYAKDVSDKVKTATNTMKRSGKNMSWLPPFGYLKDPNDRFKIMIDEEVAPIVRRIFDLCIEGLGAQKIAILLNSEQTITPAERKMQVSKARYQKSIILTEEQNRNIWTKTNVRQVLKNEAYKGTYLFNTRTYVKGKHVKRPESEWERIEHNHEPIVTADVFEQAQEIMASRHTGKNSGLRQDAEDILLRGKIFCKHCNHRLIVCKNHSNKHYFYCRYCKSQGHSMKSCRFDVIENHILNKLSNQVSVNKPQKIKQSQKTILRSIENVRRKKLTNFEEYKDEQVSREDYLFRKQKLQKELISLEEKLQQSDFLPQIFNQRLTEEVVKNKIDKVIVDCLGIFNVVYKL